MEKKVVFGLLILCGLVSQGFCTSSEENEQSPDLHIRKKRLTGFTSDIIEAPFLVSLMVNRINHCPLTLLTDNVVVTSAECLQGQRRREWKIKSFSTYHEIDNVISYGNYNESHPTINNIALAFFSPPINKQITPNRPIKIFFGNLASIHTFPIVFNWNHVRIDTGRRIQSDIGLQKNVLKFISYDYCRNYYHEVAVRDGNICTQTTNALHNCERKDTGAPLVLENQLVGIFAFRRHSSRKDDPEVFMNLLDHGIRRWIHGHIPTLRLF